MNIIEKLITTNTSDLDVTACKLLLSEFNHINKSEVTAEQSTKLNEVRKNLVRRLDELDPTQNIVQRKIEVMVGKEFTYTPTSKNPPTDKQIGFYKSLLMKRCRHLIIGSVNLHAFAGMFATRLLDKSIIYMEQISKDEMSYLIDKLKDEQINITEFYKNPKNYNHAQ
jgi:hypothetical protein